MEWLFADNAYLFSVPAIAGTAYFLISLVLGELGGDVDADLGVDAPDSPAAEFRVLSLQTFSAFAMGSGWAGLTALRVLDLGFTGATLVAIGAGLGAAWLIVMLLRAVLGLQGSGNIPLDATLGAGGIGGGHIKLSETSMADDAGAPITALLPMMTALAKIKIEVIDVEHAR